MAQQEMLVHPSSYAGVRRSVADATTLPPGAYHDPGFYKAEVERVFMKGWQFIGHEERVPTPNLASHWSMPGPDSARARGRR
jgi:choline monooxygenase